MTIPRTNARLFNITNRSRPSGNYCLEVPFQAVGQVDRTEAKWAGEDAFAEERRMAKEQAAASKRPGGDWAGRICRAQRKILFGQFSPVEQERYGFAVPFHTQSEAVS